MKWREGNGNQLHYSCLENPMDRGAWQATVHEVTESDRNELLTLSLSKQGQKLVKMCISKSNIHFGSGNWRKVHNIKLWVVLFRDLTENYSSGVCFSDNSGIAWRRGKRGATIYRSFLLGKKSKNITVNHKENKHLRLMTFAFLCMGRRKKHWSAGLDSLSWNPVSIPAHYRILKN